MQRSRVVLAAAAVLLASSPASAQRCLDRYQCRFHKDIGGQEYSWDLSPLCKEGPETNPKRSYGDATTDYFFASTVTGLNYTFNICGNTTAVCSYQVDDPTNPGSMINVPLYDSRGVAMQSIGPPPDPSAMCRDWDSGAPMPCTSICVVIGTIFLQYGLINPNDPNGGVLITHDGMPSADSDPDRICPRDDNDLLLERRIRFQISCDPNTDGMEADYAANPFQDGTAVYENPICTYTAYFKSKYACGALGDPFDNPNPQTYGPATNFGFTVLGAVLTVFVAFTYSFGDHRGWWDPIKSRIPGLRGGYSSYKSYGAGADTAGATPITASAYGTA